MQTFDCPKCGAPISYEPNAFGSGNVKCAYCQSQLSLPHHGHPARIISQIDINVGPHVAATAKKAVWVMVLIPLLIVVLVVGGVLAGVFGALAPLMRSTNRATNPSIVPGGAPSGSKSGDPANAFAREVLKFGSEGIGPGMMTDARSIGVDGQGNIYVAEYLGGRVQVFDANGKFLTQWMVDRKMPLRSMAVDRKGTVYIAQRGTITRYEGQTGNPLGDVQGESSGFDDLGTTPDGGLIAASYRGGNDNITRFNSSGNVTLTISKAISTVADRSELDTSVAVDGLGNIYALGSFTSAVFKFSPEGKFLNRFGGSGDQSGQFRAAHAIAVDGKGRVLVSDTKGIQVFDSDGRYLNVFKVDGPAFGMVFNDKNELVIAARSKVIKYTLNQ
jgi:DNA-binding beta-propeller fold protein YncE